MQPHTRALVAAATFAILTGRKAAGVYDHAAGRSRRIAAECRGRVVKAHDGDRGARFGGTLPDLFDEGDRAYVSLVLEGGEVRGHDHRSGGDFSARVTQALVQVYDYAEQAWFHYDIQNPAAARSFYR